MVSCHVKSLQAAVHKLAVASSLSNSLCRICAYLHHTQYVGCVFVFCRIWLAVISTVCQRQTS